MCCKANNHIFQIALSFSLLCTSYVLQGYLDRLACIEGCAMAA